jgi:uncharacterized membrane protein
MNPGDRLEPAELERQSRQLSRLETLMDVMFALMLYRILAPLPLPSEEEDWEWSLGASIDLFQETGADFLMAIIGVILIVIYWLQSNKLLGNLVRTNGNHVAFCIGQVVFLIFYAYAMAISADFESPATRAMQSLALAGVGFCGFLGFRYAARDRRLLSNSISDQEADALKISVLPEPVTGLVTIPLAFVGPWAWELGWLIMLPLGSWLRGRHNARYAEEI